MLKRSPWPDRQFRFDLPIALFPNVVERVRGTSARMLEKVQHLGPAVLRTRVEGRWSIQETVGHLAESEILHTRNIEEILGGAERLTPVDLHTIHKGVLRYNEIEIEEAVATFRDRRNATVSLLDGVVVEDLEKTALHDSLGHMRVIDFAWYVAEHDDHHLTGITEELPADPEPMPRWSTDLVKVKFW